MKKTGTLARFAEGATVIKAPSTIIFVWSAEKLPDFSVVFVGRALRSKATCLDIKLPVNRDNRLVVVFFYIQVDYFSHVSYFGYHFILKSFYITFSSCYVQTT